MARVPYVTNGKGGPAKQYLVLPPSPPLRANFKYLHENFTKFFFVFHGLN